MSRYSWPVRGSTATGGCWEASRSGNWSSLSSIMGLSPCPVQRSRGDGTGAMSGGSGSGRMRVGRRRSVEHGPQQLGQHPGEPIEGNAGPGVWVEVADVVGVRADPYPDQPETLLARQRPDHVAQVLLGRPA